MADYQETETSEGISFNKFKKILSEEDLREVYRGHNEKKKTRLYLIDITHKYDEKSKELKRLAKFEVEETGRNSGKGKVLDIGLIENDPTDLTYIQELVNFRSALKIRKIPFKDVNIRKLKQEAIEYASKLIAYSNRLY